MPRAFVITAEAIAKESERVGGDLEKFDVSRVIQLDQLELPEMGPRDVTCGSWPYRPSTTWTTPPSPTP